MFRFHLELCASSRALEDLLPFVFYMVNLRGAICLISMAGGETSQWKQQISWLLRWVGFLESHGYKFFVIKSFLSLLTPRSHGAKSKSN
jgi:hypothetical protein